jgi:hypothetical protein
MNLAEFLWGQWYVSAAFVHLQLVWNIELLEVPKNPLCARLFEPISSQNIGLKVVEYLMIVDKSCRCALSHRRYSVF